MARMVSAGIFVDKGTILWCAEYGLNLIVEALSLDLDRLAQAEPARPLGRHAHWGKLQYW